MHLTISQSKPQIFSLPSIRTHTNKTRYIIYLQNCEIVCWDCFRYFLYCVNILFVITFLYNGFRFCCNALRQSIFGYTFDLHDYSNINQLLSKNILWKFVVCCWPCVCIVYIFRNKHFYTIILKSLVHYSYGKCEIFVLSGVLGCCCGLSTWLHDLRPDSNICSCT